MKWGLKARFGDVNDVYLLNPKGMEFHLTDNDVLTGKLNGRVYDCNYSVHLPEYWKQVLINPCDMDKFQDNLHIYKLCIDKGLSLLNNFSYRQPMKVILHPGGASIDPVEIEEQRSILYKRLTLFCDHIREEYKDKIELLIENMPPLPWFYGGQYYSNIFTDAKEIAYFCKSNDINMCLDISHAGLFVNYSQGNLIEYIRTVKQFVRQIHIADAEGTDGEGMPIGKGNIDFKEVMQEIKDIDCIVIPEQMWGHFNGYAEFKKTIEICNSFLEDSYGRTHSDANRDINNVSI